MKLLASTFCEVLWYWYVTALFLLLYIFHTLHLKQILYVLLHSIYLITLQNILHECQSSSFSFIVLLRYQAFIAGTAEDVAGKGSGRWHPEQGHHERSNLWLLPRIQPLAIASHKSHFLHEFISLGTFKTIGYDNQRNGEYQNQWSVSPIVADPLSLIS